MRDQHVNMFTGFSKRLQMNESIELTIESLKEYCSRYKHWVISWSGGKDSTTLVTLIVWLLNTNQIPHPESLTIMYADTKVELPPLAAAAVNIIEDLKEFGFEVRIVTAPLEHRFFTYMLGRGVPPPTNTFRWCTPKLKVLPMERAIRQLVKEKGEKVLLLTGLRIGESAARDRRILHSCSKDGGECGQGWFQLTMPEDLCDSLAPILHWRVCHVWEWLKHWATLPQYGDWATAAIADAYGGDEAEELNARTGCIECNLVQEDKALNNILKQEKNYYLRPLKQLKSIYAALRNQKNRLRKTGLEPAKKNAVKSKKHRKKGIQRLGPITMGARMHYFDEIIRIQNEVNAEAVKQGRPLVILIDEEEQSFIKKCWADNLWPNDWDGMEPVGDTPMDIVYPDGSILPLIQFDD